MQVGDVTERVKEFFQDEYNAMTLYRELAEIQEDDEMKRRLMEISAMERSHMDFWGRFLERRGVRVEGGGRASRSDTSNSRGGSSAYPSSPPRCITFLHSLRRLSLIHSRLHHLDHLRDLHPEEGHRDGDNGVGCSSTVLGIRECHPNALRIRRSALNMDPPM